MFWVLRYFLVALNDVFLIRITKFGKQIFFLKKRLKNCEDMLPVTE